MVQNCNKIINKEFFEKTTYCDFKVFINLYYVFCLNKEMFLNYCPWPSNRLVLQIKPHPKSCQCPLLNYLHKMYSIASLQTRAVGKFDNPEGQVAIQDLLKECVSLLYLPKHGIQI